MIKLSKEVLELLDLLFKLDQDEDDLDEFYGDSVRAGCDCGCGGDSMMESWSEINEQREECIERLNKLGFDVSAWSELDDVK